MSPIKHIGCRRSVSQSVHFKGEVIVSRNRITPPLDQTESSPKFRCGAQEQGVGGTGKQCRGQIYSTIARWIRPLRDHLQRSAKRLVRGCEKFVPALPYMFCPALPGSCLARFTYFFADLCTKLAQPPLLHLILGTPSHCRHHMYMPP